MVKSKSTKAEVKSCCSCGHSKIEVGKGGAIYGLGFIGAAIYFISHSTGFWSIILGILKAIVWPAFMVYSVFKFIGL